MRSPFAAITVLRQLGRACASSCCLLFCMAMASAVAADRPHTAGPTVRVLTPPLRLPAIGVARTLRIYLPPDYATANARRYPVVYMFDGQNLFDDATSYMGEWGVDESMDKFARDGFSAIVVGIDHGNAQRVHELIPYWNLRFLPNQGVGFLDDLVNVIKPYVDANYRTLPDRAHTAIMGSSLGGLEADYAVHRYPQVFGRAGVLSPSYWVSDEAFAIAARAPLLDDTRVYLYIGGREGEEAVPDVRRMAAILRLRPDMTGGVALHVVDDAEHNERAWRSEFPRAVRWLFPPSASSGIPAPTASSRGAR